MKTWRPSRRPPGTIPWLEIRKSTGGGGLHVYALCCDEGIPTANHTEHAALGRAILEKMAVIAGFNFSKKVDICGGNMWIWHRKIDPRERGLQVAQGSHGAIVAGRHSRRLAQPSCRGHGQAGHATDHRRTGYGRRRV